MPTASKRAGVLGGVFGGVVWSDVVWCFVLPEAKRPAEFVAASLLSLCGADVWGGFQDVFRWKKRELFCLGGMDPFLDTAACLVIVTQHLFLGSQGRIAFLT